MGIELGWHRLAKYNQSPGVHPHHYIKPGMLLMLACNPRAGDVEACESNIQGHSQRHEASPRYMIQKQNPLNRIHSSTLLPKEIPLLQLLPHLALTLWKISKRHVHPEWFSS